MNNELNEFMATEVMGWKKVIRPPTYACIGNETAIYTDGRGGGEFVSAWHPDTDMNQVLMCATKARVYIGIKRNLKYDEEWDVERNGFPFGSCGLKELPLVICEAIYGGKR